MTTQNMIEKAYSTTPTASTISEWDANVNLSANNHIEGFTSTVSSASPITLTVGSPQQQFITGSTAQTFVMPVAATLVEGMSWYIVNQSSAVTTVQSSGGNTIIAMAANTTAVVTCILNSGTSAASWFAEYEQSSLVLPLSLANGGTGQSLSTVNNAVFSTDGSGNSQISTTLPTNIAVTTPKITTGIKDANGNTILGLTPTASAVNFFTMTNAATNGSPIIGVTGSDTNIILTLIGQGTGGVEIQGSTAIGNGGAGYIGEVMVSSVAVSPGVSLTTNTAADVTTLSLTAGDWDIWGNVGFTGATGTSITELIAWSSSSSAALPSASLRSDHLMSAFVLGGSTFNFTIPSTRVNISSPATYYLSARATFTVSTLTACGNIYARRAR